MAREGNHSATLTVKGNARSADRELQALAQRQGKFEANIDRTNAALAKQADRLNRAHAAGKKHANTTARVSGAFLAAGGYVAAATAADVSSTTTAAAAATATASPPTPHLTHQSPRSTTPHRLPR